VHCTAIGGWLAVAFRKNIQSGQETCRSPSRGFSLTPSGWWPPHGCCVSSWATIQISNSQFKTKVKITAYCQMNLINLNLMAGVSLDAQSKETPAMKSSGKMGNSPKFPAFLRAK